jgi:hypothetical protein
MSGLVMLGGAAGVHKTRSVWQVVANPVKCTACVQKTGLVAAAGTPGMKCTACVQKTRVV